MTDSHDYAALVKRLRNLAGLDENPRYGYVKVHTDDLRTFATAISTLLAERDEARGKTAKELCAIIDDLRRRAPFGYHEGGAPPHHKMLILHNNDVEKLLDALLDAAISADKGERAVARSDAAQALLKEAGEVVEPFARAAEDLHDNARDVSDLWESPAALSILAANLRDARTFLTKLREQS